MWEPLLAFALSVLGPGPDAATIAPAIVRVIQWRADHGLPPVTESPTLDVALVAVYIRHESSVMLDPPPVSKDARDLTSCGALQLPCSYVAKHGIARQIQYWLVNVQMSSLASVDSSPSRARRRLSEARDALRGAI